MPGNKIDDYEVICTIGSGAYGTCKKIKRRADGKIRVWKELDYGSMSNEEKSLLVSEVNLLRELKHPNIVRYHDRIIDKVATKIFIVMEYCEGGDLAAYILSRRKARDLVEEDFIWKALYQLSLALSECHIHAKGKGLTVLHRDLKPANVFLDSQNNCKLGDFGLARVMHDTSFAKTFVGTPYYMSPELVNRKNYNQKSDIWALGCLIYELASLMPPFLAANQKVLAMKIKEGHFRPLPSKYSSGLNSIVSRMLTVVESQRPTIEDILNSPGVRAYKNRSEALSSAAVNQPGIPQDAAKLYALPYKRQSTCDDSIEKRENDLMHWENYLKRKEEKLTEKEKSLAKLQQELERERQRNRLFSRQDKHRPVLGHHHHRLDDIDNKENVVKMEEGDDIDFVDNNINHHYNKLHQHQKPFDHHHYQQQHQQQLRQLGRLESKVYNQPLCPSRPLRHLDTNNINFNRYDQQTRDHRLLHHQQLYR